ncbi:hypothetical protein ACFE04_017496 [Oxalis oulophora]
MSEFIRLNDDYDDRHSDEEITKKRRLIFTENEIVERDDHNGHIKKASKEIVMHAKAGEGTEKERLFNESVKFSMKITGHKSKVREVRNKRNKVKKFNHLEDNVIYEKEDSSTNDYYVIFKSSNSV